jgi:hypothetical protein
MEDIAREEGGEAEGRSEGEGDIGAGDSDNSSDDDRSVSGNSEDFLLNEQRRVVEEQPDTENVESDESEGEEHLQSGQRRLSGDTRPVGTYRPKRRGPGQYVSRAKYYRFHAQRRDPTGQKQLHRFHRLYHMGTLS